MRPILLPGERSPVRASSSGPRDYLGKRNPNPLQIWKAWCTNIEGAEVASGHFIAEENPQAMLAALLPFLASVKDGA